MSRQGTTLFNARHRMTGISQRFPLIGNVLAKIKSKTNRESLILGSVIGVCSFLFLWYLFR